MNSDLLLARCATVALAVGTMMCGGNGPSRNPADGSAGAPGARATGGATSTTTASTQQTAPVTGGAPHRGSGTPSSVSTPANAGASARGTAWGGGGSLGGASTMTPIGVVGGSGTVVSTATAGATASTGGSGTTISMAVAGASADERCANVASEVGASCGAATVRLRPSNVLIVLDKSGSMNSAPDGLRTKWESTRHALSALMARRATSVDYGLLLYPYVAAATATTCELASGGAAVNVPVGPAPLVAPRIEQLIAATSPSGGTPTAAALAAALEYYTVGNGAAIIGPKYVLLVTDGGPNCNGNITCSGDTCTANLDGSGSCGTSIANCCDMQLMTAGGLPPNLLCLDYQAVISQIQTLRTNGVQTFVVGIPGTEVYASYLDEFAIAGGVPRVASSQQPYRYYAVATEAELTNTLTTIAASLGRECVIPLEGGPFDAAQLHLLINCEPLPARTTQGQNWSYDASTNSIAITPSTCGELQNGGISRVDVVRGCPAN